MHEVACPKCWRYLTLAARTDFLADQCREIYVSDRVSNMMLHQFVGGSRIPNDSPVAGLTDRELEVFRLIGEGHATRHIA
jgi:DNA-binding NarL/FixJ family response regulator